MPADSRFIIEKIESSPAFNDYGKAFKDATGLPLEITEVNQVKFALCTKTHGTNAFCRMMGDSGYQCDTCRVLNQRISEELHLPSDNRFTKSSSDSIGLIEKSPQSVSGINESFWDSGPKTFECFAGMCESMVPIRADGDIIGFLKTGQVLIHKPTKTAFRRAIETIRELEPKQEDKELERNYFKTPVLPPQQYEAMVMLLKSFSDQLSSLAEKIVLEIDHSDPVFVQKAKNIMLKQFCEPLTLEEIAIQVPVSHHHLSRKFKETTGIGVMEFLTMIRVDHAKDLLHRKDMGIAEIAFSVGFQSLAPFNKAFKKITGKSPKEFRKE